jgi:hypothetical protein
MMTSVVLIFLLVFMIWPDSQPKLESAVRKRLPRLFYLTSHTIQRYHADIENRYSNPAQRNQMR